MKFSSLANKKINWLLQNEHELRESRFADSFLYPGFKFSMNNCGLFLIDLKEFNNRCISFNVQIIGLEIHPDSDYPFYVYCIEDYGQEYSCDWLNLAIKDLEKNKVQMHILPYISVPKEILDYYLTDDAQ